jgi:hypothetical protein
MFRKIARCAPVITASTLLALVFVAGPLHADIGGPDGSSSWPRLLAYASCSLAIAAASSGLGVAGALVACLRILYMTF